MSQPPPIVLSFAASDSTGGAGIQADILTLASMGCHALSVVTAITVQDTAGVDDVMALEPEWVADQARAVLEDMPVHVFKIGLLGSVEIITAIAEVVSDYPNIPLVLDPVLASGRGDELTSDEMVAAMRELLLPQATIITPNSFEARRLAQDDDDDDNEMPHLSQCAARLLHMGCEYVLITGSYHGSGCTLASAIAASIANGLPIAEGVYEAQEYTWQSLKAGFRPGMGQHLPDRLFWARDDTEIEEENKSK